MFRAAWHGIRNLFSPSRAQRDVQDELDAYFEAAVAEKIAAGVPESEARRQVRFENGTPDSIGENVHAARWETSLDSTWRDLRYGLRMLHRNPGVATVAVMTLALGIGSTTAVYSVVRGVLLRPFPFPQQDRLLMIWQKGEDGKSSNVGYATLEDFRKLNHSFSSISAVSFWTPTLVTSAESENLSGFRVSAGTFDMLGVRMAQGRDFVRDEDVQGRGMVVVLSHGLWQRRFGSDPRIVGKSVQLGSKSYTVVGVLPENCPSVFSFDPRKEAEIYSPLAYDTSLPYACRTCQHLRALGRLRDGVAEQQALAEMNQISNSLVQQYPTEYSNAGVLFTQLHEYVVGDVRPVLTALLGAVGFVLLIACVNVSNLLVSSAVKRRREFALRVSLGAQSIRLVRQMLTESLLLSLIGGTLGVIIAWSLFFVIPRIGLANVAKLHDIRLDAGVFLFTLLTCIASSIAFGVLPALHARGVDPAESLKEGLRSTASGARLKLRNTLIVCDVAISLVLVVGAGLMVKSFLRLANVDPGFSSDRVLTLTVSLWGQKYSTDAATVNFYRAALDKVAILPGVESAALTSQLPLGGNMDRYGVHIVDKPRPNPENDPSADRYSISPDYFRTLRIPFQRGRTFTDADRADTTRVAVINETFANMIWPGEDPIGKQFRVGDIKSAPRTVVGVVGDVLHTGLDAPHTPQFYLPNTQFTDSDVTLVIRAKSGDPAALATDVRRAISSVDPLQPISQVATMSEIVTASAVRQKFSALVFAGFALCGLLMAAVGIYGVIAYSVAQRTQEIGIRIAMGAQTHDVLGMIVKKGMQPAVLGLIIGMALALGATQFLASLLFSVKPYDSDTFVLMSIVVLVVTFLACYLPARRATRIDPIAALRTE